jgi:hypothetical protein
LERLSEAEAEHAAGHRDHPIPPDAPGSRPNRARSVMFSVRLNLEEFTAVQELAREADVPASTLARLDHPPTQHRT